VKLEERRFFATRAHTRERERELELAKAASLQLTELKQVEAMALANLPKVPK